MYSFSSVRPQISVYDENCHFFPSGGNFKLIYLITLHIKKYQIIVGTILLMIVPLSYIALKMGYPPEAVFVVHLIIVILAQCVRVIMVKNMISMPISEYVKRVVLRIFAVVATSVVFPIILHLKLPNSLLCIMLTCLVSCISVLLSVYILGLTVVERNKINLKIIKYIKKR